ncbi:hypothetical protein BDU57DRAFT_522890 [Ampelomyces quisqualis]|uniref:Uncharacterized protein n=1 Tax=Ampelomyces quisqualis TaxID=50730 RepID=A0A6A5QAZ2_AMPQU|nr:hypothetical protein BDU57DRAFT_522890 [Ampelomyces quisqualis]
MVYTLSIRPYRLLKRSFGDKFCLQSGSSINDALPVPLSDITACNASSCSLYSLGSNASGTVM